MKDSIEALGVPHPEVDLVLVNGASVGFDYLLRDGDRVSVYPVFEALDIAPVSRLRPAPLRDTRFIVDVNLGRLAVYPRLLGIDTSFDPAQGDEALARGSAAEHRVLLTRDVGLLKRGLVSHGYCVRATAPRQQLAEVVER